jgi:cysteine desulfurase family protein
VKSIYLDNAATSWPKPAGVPWAVYKQIKYCGGNPGRSAHAKSIDTARLIMECREAAAELLNISDSSKIIFTSNATEGLNLVIRSKVNKKTRVVTTSMEHNSVLRPLMFNGSKKNIRIVEGDNEGFVDPLKVIDAIDEKTDFVCMIHASNVTGTVNDVKIVIDYCKDKNIPFLLDASQSCGSFPIDIEVLDPDYLAAPGHKCLLGPSGTGILYVKNHQTLSPLCCGGTGSFSEKIIQPDFLPDKFESGTINSAGIAGLKKGLDFVLRKGISEIHEHEKKLFEVFSATLLTNDLVSILGTNDTEKKTGIASVIIEGMSPSEIGNRLEGQFGILTRVGLHCAPLSHKTIGTYDEGSVRFSWGIFNTEKDMIKAAKAITMISAEAGL